jgi:hypothetical protein
MARLTASQRIARILRSDPALTHCGIDFERPGTCELRDRTLRVSARSPAEKAKLRQSGPLIERTLSAHGFEGIEIKVTVQPCYIDYRKCVSGKNPALGTTLGSKQGATRYSELMLAKAFAEKLAQTIENPLIRASAERMSRAAQIRLAGMRDDGDVDRQGRTPDSRP